MSLLKGKIASFFHKKSGEGNETDDKQISPDDLACKQRAEAALEEMLVLMRDAGWRHEKTVGTDVIKSLQTAAYGKIFKLEGEVETSASALFDKFNYNYEPFNWNPALHQVKRLRKIDENTDVQYIVTNEYAAGLVSKRDYVYLRTWRKRGNAIEFGMTSSKLLNYPLQEGLIRGEHGPSGYIFTPCGQDNSRCQVQWICNCTIKGWIPQVIIDQTLPYTMSQSLYALRKPEDKKKKTYS